MFQDDEEQEESAVAEEEVAVQEAADEPAENGHVADESTTDGEEQVDEAPAQDKPVKKTVRGWVWQRTSTGAIEMKV